MTAGGVRRTTVALIAVAALINPWIKGNADATSPLN